MGLGVWAASEVQVCGVQVLPQHYWCGCNLQRAGNSALIDGGPGWHPKGAFSLVDCETHGGGNLSRFGEGIVDILRPNEASDVVDVREGSAAFVLGGSERLELLNYG